MKSDKIKNYLDKASELKAKYDEEINEYKIANNLIKEEKPKNAFYYFKISKIDELSESNPDKSKKELNKMIQTQWKELNSEKCETVKKFLEIANEKKKNYNNSVVLGDDNKEVMKKKIKRIIVDDSESDEEELDRTIEY